MLSLAGGTRLAPSQPAPADWLLRNGRLYTVEASRPWAEALAVKAGRIVFVGPDAEAAAHRGPGTQVIDLKGHLVLPGFNDSHFHLSMGAQLLDTIDLLEARDLAEIQRLVREYARANPQAAWIRGRGWFYSALPGGRPPTRADLDAVESARPVFLDAYDGHTGWANSRALERAGIRRDTPDPPHGMIVRDPGTREPTGMLKEAAMDLVQAAVPKPSRAELLALLRRALALMASHGLTSIQNAHGTVAEVELYEELERAGQLTVRTYTALSARPPSDVVGGVPFASPQELARTALSLKSRYRGPLVKAGAVKIVADGVIEAHTASMLEPYANAPGTRGLPNYSPAEMADLVRLLDGRGLQVFTHAIGDRAVRITLDAYEQARAANGPRDRRPRIEHIETHQAADTARFGALGVLAVMQPLHANPTDNQRVVWAGNIGPERASRAWAWSSLRRAGAVLAFGSDWPVVSMNPFLGLHVAVNRQTPQGEPAGGWLPEQRLKVEEAVEAYTLGGAFASFDEDDTGSLRPGKWADLVVLRHDLFTTPPARIHANQVLLTMVGGRIVHRSDF